MVGGFRNRVRKWRKVPRIIQNRFARGALLLQEFVHDPAIPDVGFPAGRRRVLTVAAICIGASLGALARWGLGLWLNPGAVLPLGTLAANLIGGYLVGVCVAVFQALPHLDPVWRLALVTGFLGALTTFSSFSAEVVGMLGQQRYALALGTAGLHLFGSLLLTVAGIRTASTFLLK
jgi:CrcB protein